MPLSTKDKRVIKAFADKKKASGRLLDTDGKVLEKMGMGGGQFARWDGHYVKITRVSAVRSDDVILRALRKAIPKNWLKEGHGMSTLNQLVEAMSRYGDYRDDFINPSPSAGYGVAHKQFKQASAKLAKLSAELIPYAKGEKSGPNAEVLRKLAIGLTQLASELRNSTHSGRDLDPSIVRLSDELYRFRG